MTEVLQTVMTRLRLDPERLVFTLRTVGAAVIALYLGTALGLQHPNWAVMAVLSVSQPTRERLFLKGCLRVAGSVAGALAGIFILLVAGTNSLLMLGLLSVWIGVFVAGTVLLRGLFSYFAIVCSFTAAMVVLLVSNQPEGLWAMGVDRMLTAALGVVVVGVIAAVFTPKAPVDMAIFPLKKVLMDLLGLLSRPYDAVRAEQHLLELMNLEASLDAKSDGTRRRSRRICSLRRSISAMLRLSLLHGRQSGLVASSIAERMADAHSRLSAGSPLEDTIPALREAAARADDEAPELARGLHALVEALGDFVEPAAQPAQAKAHLHHDWPTARLAFLRVMIAFWVLGLVWVLTGWEAGAYLLISMTVMITVYSSADEPLGLAFQSFIGQVIGVAGALFCVAVLWPLSSSVWMAAAAAVPLLLAGGIVWARGNLTVIAYDILMSMILILNPQVYQDMSLSQAIPIGIAIFSGPLIVWGVFRTVLPLDRMKKVSVLREVVRRDLLAMARRPVTAEQGEVWRARLYHRILRLTQLQQNLGLPTQSIAADGMAWLDLADAIDDLHDIIRSTDSKKSYQSRIFI